MPVTNVEAPEHNNEGCHRPPLASRSYKGVLLMTSWPHCVAAILIYK